MVWILVDREWRLAGSPWDSEQFARSHSQAVTALGPAENHPGYPPFSISDQHTPSAPMPTPCSGPRLYCPANMSLIPAGPGWRRFAGQRFILAGERDRIEDVPAFCIDRYEASRPAVTISGEFAEPDMPAISQAGALPWVNVTWAQAKAACERAGKRLCTGPEWQKAAGSSAGYLFPYGNEFQTGRCNTSRPGTGGVPAPTGQFRQCRTDAEVYDLCGNVSEWTDEEWQPGLPDRVLRGGSFNENANDDQGLYPFFGWRFVGYSQTVAAIHHHPPNVTHPDDGFRCCAAPRGPQ
jgi:hypothetical protein